MQHNMLLRLILTVAVFFVTGCARDNAKLQHKKIPFSTYQSPSIEAKAHFVDSTNQGWAARKVIEKINCIGITINNKTESPLCVCENPFRPSLINKYEISDMADTTKFLQCFVSSTMGVYAYITLVSKFQYPWILLLTDPFQGTLLFLLLNIPICLVALPIAALSQSLSNASIEKQITNLTHQLYQGKEKLYLSPNRTTTIFIATHQSYPFQLAFDVMNERGEREHCTLK